MGTDKFYRSLNIYKDKIKDLEVRKKEDLLKEYNSWKETDKFLDGLILIDEGIKNGCDTIHFSIPSLDLVPLFEKEFGFEFGYYGNILFLRNKDDVYLDILNEVPIGSSFVFTGIETEIIDKIIEKNRSFSFKKKLTDVTNHRTYWSYEKTIPCTTKPSIQGLWKNLFNWRRK